MDRSQANIVFYFFQYVSVVLMALLTFTYIIFQTGSGKTYTMWGPANALCENLTNDKQGLTPRIFERLFGRINEVY